MPAPAGRRPGTVVARLTAKKAVRSAALWGYVFGAYVAASALGYAATYKTVATRRSFASTFGSNFALNALIGPARGIDTVAGFTVWRCLGVLSVVGAVWGLLTGTRLLRGEEDAGRWELLLAGQTTRRRAAAQGLAGLYAGLAVLWLITALVTAVVGQSSKVEIGVGAALFFALALVLSAAVFLAVGTLAGQLAATRRRAAGYAGAALGACYALRMAADSGAGLDWLRWITPLGWIEELRPISAPNPLVLLPVMGLTAGLALLAVHWAGIRDLGSSILPDSATAAPRTRLLSGTVGFGVRLVRASVVAWAAAIAAGTTLLGFISKSAGNSLKGNSTVERILSRLGAPGVSADTYLGVAFLIVAVMVALLGAGLLAATRAEEAEGQLDNLVVRPVARISWLAARLAVVTGATVLSSAVGGVFAWVGAASQHAGASLPTLLAAGLNVVPPALCVLGIGVLVFGVRPRATSGVVYGLIAWGLLIEIVGGAVNLDHWVLDTSVFHQMAAAPAVAPNWTTGAVLAAVGAVTMAVGAVAFGRRDLAGQ